MYRQSLGASRRILSLLSVFVLMSACKKDDHSETSQVAGAAGANMQRSLVVSGLADPDVLKVNDDLFFLVGTGVHPDREIPLYESRDLERFHFKRNYVPSSVDKSFDYCDLWAPDLSLQNGRYSLYFSATRVPKGQPCSKNGAQPATYLAIADGTDLAFGVPHTLREHDKGPRTVVNPQCPADGCQNAIRIDVETAEDWLFYVWFDRGNNISSFRMSDPNRVIHNTGPAKFAIGGDEESINEGASIFRRDSRYYMFFSTGNFDSQYGMQYVMADSIDKLTRSQGVRRYSRAVRNSAGKYLENHGHNTIVERRGEFFNIFHLGYFNPEGRLAGRDTYKQRLRFHPDGTIAALNMIDLSWKPVPNASYSLDVITRSGERIGPCFDASRLGKSTSVAFNDICPSARDRIIYKNDIAAFHLFWSDNGKWGDHSKMIQYDGFSDKVFIGNTTHLSWKPIPNASYSLDVITRSGERIGPCLDASRLGKSTSVAFHEVCPSAKDRVINKNDIAAFHLFWSDNGKWGDRSKRINYDGISDHVFLDL